MTTICMDASVVGMLISPDEWSESIIARYEELRLKETRFIGPSLLPYEMLSILRKKETRRLLTGLEILAALRYYHGLGIKLLHIEYLMERTLSLCQNVGPRLTPYDAAYLVVAEEEDAILWSADREFCKLVRPVFPGIEYLGPE